MRNSSYTKRIAYDALLLALALIFSYVEVLIPFNFGVPGIKLGLANAVVLLGLFFLNPLEVLLVSTSRIVLASFMFGNLSMLLYSMAGGMVSFLVMFIFKKVDFFNIVGISILGAISHNIGQVMVAIAVVENVKIAYYLPILLISGVITGILIGIIADRCKYIFRRLRNE